MTEPEINAYNASVKIETYPEMNKRIVEILRLGYEPMDLYAAARIEELEQRCAELEQRCAEMSNDPLKLDELREMVGEPVYLIWNGREGFYALISNVTETHLLYKRVNGWEENAAFSAFGEFWRAYRRKAKE